MRAVSKGDRPFVTRLETCAKKGAKAFVAIYADNVSKIADRDTAYYLDPCPRMIDAAVAKQKWSDASLLLRVYATHGVAVGKPNEIVLSQIGVKAIETAMALDDDELFTLAQKHLRHKKGPNYEFLFHTACYHAKRGDKPKMLAAIMATLKSFRVGAAEFTKAPAFAAWTKDPDFQLAAKGKFVAGPTAKAGPNKAAAAKHPKGLVVWNTKPTKKAVYDATKAFFDALAQGKVDAAKAMLMHDAGFEENVSALYREMRAVDGKLKAKRWSEDLSWLKNVSIGKLETDDAGFDADDSPEFFVAISYRSSSTDTTAEFEVRDVGDDYVLACKIIHVM